MKRVTYLVLLALSLLTAGCGVKQVETAAEVGSRLGRELKPLASGAPAILQGGVRLAPRVAKAIDGPTAREVEAELARLDVRESTIQKVLQYLEKRSGEDSKESVVEDLLKDQGRGAICDALTTGFQSGRLPTGAELDTIFQDRLRRLPEEVRYAFIPLPAQWKIARDVQDSMNGLKRDANISDEDYARQVYTTVFNESCNLIP
jgi:hypothetical protein